MASDGKRWIKVTMSIEQREALTAAAELNVRDVRRQALAYIVEGLARDGLVDTGVEMTCPHCQRSLTIGESVVIDALGVDPPLEANQ
jgi:hypothetical protein